MDRAVGSAWRDERLLSRGSCNGDGMSCSGGLISDALAWVVDNGLASEEGYPYVGTECG
jgi:hypothetical protein